LQYSKEIVVKGFSIGPALAAFHATVEHGGFAPAAGVLKISAAAVGQSVARLEVHFGVRLLNRTTRRMSLTSEGAELLERSRSLLGDIEEINRFFEESRGVASGPLRISAPVGIARHLLVPLLADFMEQHREIRLEVDATDAIRDFAAGRLDLAFRVLQPQDSTIIARPIAPLQAVTVASPAYLARHGTPLHPVDLAAHRCIAYRFINSSRLSDNHFTVDGKPRTVPIDPVFIANDVELACDAAAEGIGIAQPPLCYARPYIDTDRLVPILAPYVAAPWSLLLCYPSRERLPLRVRAFIEFTLSRLPGHPGLLALEPG
jgi:DNA-binding transcriptional LysR family regulator